VNEKILNEGNQIYTQFFTVSTFVVPFYYNSGSAKVRN
jgi:hypothetical protein